MSALSILAVQNAPLLRALATDPNTSKAELATAVGKDRSNLNRSIAALAEAGLLAGTDDGQRVLTDDGRAQLAAIDRAEGGEGKPGSSDGLPDDHVLAVHAQLMPDPDNARKDWDSEEAVADLTELAESIDQRGLLQNPMVKLAPADLQIPGQPTTYMLDGGERRWRAIGRLIADGRWPAERRIICRLIETDDLGHRLAALAENMQRRNLNPLEKARAFDGLAEALAAQGVAPDKINRDIADRVGVTIEHVQQHRSFLKLDPADQEKLALPKDDPKRLSVRDARQKVAAAAQAEAKAAEVAAFPIEQRLALSEALHAVATRGKYSWDSVIVRPGFAESELGQALKAADWLRFDGPMTYGSEKLGHFAVSRGYGAPTVLGTPFWTGTEEEHEATLRRLQAEAGHPGRTDYVTEWLNGPFELTEEGRTIVEETKAAEAERAAASEAFAREQEAKKAEAAATAERQAAAAARARELFDAHRQTAPASADVTTLAQDAEAPLPWRRAFNGNIVAANDALVLTGNSGWAEARMRLTILAVNAAGGFETPEDEPDPNPVLDRDAFTASMAQALTNHGLEGDAAQILETFLNENGVGFGADGWDWTGEGAETLAVEFVTSREDDDGEQACRVCGCTESNACVDDDGPCGWAEDDLCTACVGKEANAEAPAEADA